MLPQDEVSDLFHYTHNFHIFRNFLSFKWNITEIFQISNKILPLEQKQCDLLSCCFCCTVFSTRLILIKYFFVAFATISSSLCRFLTKYLKISCFNSSECWYFLFHTFFYLFVIITLCFARKNRVFFLKPL